MSISAMPKSVTLRSKSLNANKSLFEDTKGSTTPLYLSSTFIWFRNSVSDTSVIHISLPLSFSSVIFAKVPTTQPLFIRIVLLELFMT